MISIFIYHPILQGHFHIPQDFIIMKVFYYFSHLIEELSILSEIIGIQSGYINIDHISMIIPIIAPGIQIR